ncbi:MAG: anthrone oxygenase family protein [Umezawaea sp.]
MSAVLVFANLFFAGVLAGFELMVRFGVRGPLAALDDVPHLKLRIGLIGTLRILVPSAYVPAFLTGIAVVFTTDTGLLLRSAAVLAMLVWTVTTVAGTAPLNSAVYEWDPTAPPSDWRAVIHRWERMDTVRTVAATAAFGLLLVAAA